MNTKKHCEFKALKHKFKGDFVLKTGFKVRFKDFLYTKINLSQKSILLIVQHNCLFFRYMMKEFSKKQDSMKLLLIYRLK